MGEANAKCGRAEVFWGFHQQVEQPFLASKYLGLQHERAVDVREPRPYLPDARKEPLEDQGELHAGKLTALRREACRQDHGPISVPSARVELGHVRQKDERVTRAQSAYTSERIPRAEQKSDARDEEEAMHDQVKDVSLLSENW